jgi:putative pyruvate formate lyase activating enzyme
VPAHLFYLSGCDLRCVFCIAEVDAFDPRRGEPLTSSFFNAAVAWGKQQGARTLEWVGGEPTIHLPAILDVMGSCPDLPRVIWKSDFHCTPEALDLLDGAIDVYVADFKFGNDACARRIAGIKNYMSIVTRNLRQASDQADLIVRHLLLPGHFECCYLPMVAWLKQNMPTTKFSLRDGYLPKWRARHYTELAYALGQSESRRAFELAYESGLNVIV